jgi:ubiquinone biosynthesis accessory factor UbiJ
MLERGAVAALNHVLAQHPWAQKRLAPFAGQKVLLRCPPFPDLAFGVLESGLLGEPGAAEAALTVTLAPSVLPLLLSLSKGLRDDAALKQVRIEGSAELAETVRSLFAHLSWDVEEDLSRVFGDALARRIAAGGKALLEWQRDAAVRLGENLAEYWKEEQPLLARPADVAAFCRDVDALRDDVARLEKRLDLLRSASKQRIV